MIRVKIEETALEDDDPKDAAAAYAAGWRIEEDDWWVRPLKGGDSPLDAREGFVEQRHVYMPGADCCMRFDAARANASSQ